jgi:hypothetical protein
MELEFWVFPTNCNYLQIIQHYMSEERNLNTVVRTSHFEFLLFSEENSFFPLVTT